jgi:hypothetical protein
LRSPARRLDALFHVVRKPGRGAHHPAGVQHLAFIGIDKEAHAAALLIHSQGDDLVAARAERTDEPEAFLRKNARHRPPRRVRRGLLLDGAIIDAAKRAEEDLSLSRLRGDAQRQRFSKRQDAKRQRNAPLRFRKPKPSAHRKLQFTSHFLTFYV